MKKKILLITLMVAMLLCLFAIVASAETPSMYIEFGVRLEGSDNYVTVYTANAESSGNPRVDLNNDFYTNVDFSTAVDKTKITGIDFSVAVSHNTSSTVNRITAASDPAVFAKCEEIKWFTTGFTTFMTSKAFKGWTGLKSFDFGCLTTLGDNDFEGTGFVNLVIPATITKFSNSTFASCTSLKTVEFEGALTSIGLSSFYNCTALTSADLGPNTVVGFGMFSGCTSLATVTFDDASSITEIKGEAFYNCKSLNMNYTFTNVTALGYNTFRNSATNDGCGLILSFPSLVTLGGDSGDTHVFSGSGATELYFGNDITTMSHNTFSQCKKLWKVEFAGITQGFEFKSYTFDDCTALKAFSIPEGITTLPERMFKNCSSLTAVYLPSTLTAINSGSNDAATFKGCSSMYFVSEPFTFATAQDIPSEPDVYFFPNGLATVSGEMFDYARVNDVVVFGTSLNTISNSYMFEGTKSKSGTPTVVFLADTQSISCGNWNVNSIYFCNENDIDATTAGVTGSKTFIYCHADSNTTHLQNPKGATSQGATCLEKGMTFKTCFCNTKFDITVDESTSPLGHIYLYDTITAMTYTDYTKDGVITCDCDREGCEGVKAETVTGSYLFTYLGYSKNDSGDMCVGYTVNKEFAGYYKTIKAEKFSFGLVGTVIDFEEVEGEKVMVQGEDTPLAENYAGKITKADLTSYEGLSAYDMVIKGFGAKEEYQALYLAMNLYVIDGESTYYIWEGTNSVVNYKQYSAL